MIKIENVGIYGWESAIRGMRNPMNSWHKSDSGICATVNCENCKYKYSQVICESIDESEYIIGRNDFALMQSLVKAGSDHSKFMRMITVTLDITAPLYWWKEFDTYKVGTVRNSCSTMHKVHSKEFTLDDFSCEYCPSFTNGVIGTLETWRKEYLETKDKKYWYAIIQLLPSNYNQRATVQLNYAVLRNMYHSRKNHKLDEWRIFCDWIESLPYSELITGKGIADND